MVPVNQIWFEKWVYKNEKKSEKNEPAGLILEAGVDELVVLRKNEGEGDAADPTIVYTLVGASWETSLFSMKRSQSTG